MGEYLPGDLHDRLRELRESSGIKSQQKLAQQAGNAPCTRTEASDVPLWSGISAV